MYFKIVKFNAVIITIVITGFLPGCSNPVNRPQNSFSIHGKISGLTTDTVFLSNSLTDSLLPAEVKAGEFYFSGHVNYPDVFNVYLDSTRTSKFRLFVENSDISITGNIDSLDDLKVNGSESYNELTAFQLLTRPIDSMLNSLEELMGNAWKDGRVDDIDSLNEVYDSLTETKLKQVFSYSKNNKSSPIIPFISYLTAMDDPESRWIDSIYLTTNDEIKKSPRFTAIYDMRRLLMPINIGEVAPDFVMPSITGTQLTLSHLRGKIVLLDFWASWCGPCRKNHPDLVDLFKQYSNNNLEIISVSLDKDARLWKTAVQKDNLVWSQLCDLKGGKGEVATKYHISVIPACFLIDSSGKIVAKNIHGKKLRYEIGKLISTSSGNDQQ